MIYNQIMDFVGCSIVKIFVFLGPLYIKLGQLLSYNYPIFDQLHNLQNNCPGLKDGEMKYYLNKYQDLNIDPKHIAAGSISVVYTGLYKDKEIAIKVKRPNIERKINNNIYYANLLKKIILYIPFFKFLNLKNKIEYVFELYRKQIDFKQEVENWKMYKNNNIGVKNLKIPFFFQELCNDEIIVMEYLPGYNLVKNKIINQDEKLKIGHCIMGQYISGIFKGFIHGDLHCGNLAYYRDNIIIYDYGIMINLSSKDSNSIISIINCIFTKDIERIIILILETFIENNEEVKDISKIVKNLKDIEFKDNIDLLSLLLKIKKILEINGLFFNNKMIAFELSLISLNTTIKQLDVKGDPNFLLNDMLDNFQKDFLKI
jgi:ubiquinone biosynthesis protein